jgi:hypothetical protein
MLRPRSYPELIGKALVLEAQPFEVMVDDDQPWIEGLTLILTVGLLVGLARLIGGLLLSASLPPADAVLTTLLNGWREFNAQVRLDGDGAASEAALRQAWSSFTWLRGYDRGWGHLWSLILTPLGLLLQWLIASLIVFAAARAQGGRGSFNQTLGATALMVAPQILLMLQILPFVAVSGLLLAVWSLLILYRAVEVTHELPWQRAALVAALPYALLVILSVLGAGLAGLAITMGGGA